MEKRLKEKKDYFREFGVNLWIEDGEGRDIQFEGIVNSIRKALGFWKHPNEGWC